MAVSPVSTAVALLWSALAPQTASGPEPAGAAKPGGAIAQIQAPSPAGQSAPEIVITGSRIPRRNLTAVSPVTMIKGEEVKLQGAVLTEDLINQLPQVTPDQGAFISNAASGTATGNLRNLGAARTLILVNGRRLLPGDPVNPAGDI